MTAQTITRFDLLEISSVEITCECGSVVKIPLPKLNLADQLQCAGCNLPLWDHRDSPIRLHAQALVRALSEWQKNRYKKFGLGFSLVHDGNS